MTHKMTVSKLSENVKISVISATYNAGESLPALIESLRGQTSVSFEWVVADGGSTDNTLSLLSDIKDFNVTVSSQSDFGIYDAINRALQMASGQYYLVVGADDVLFSDCIEKYGEIADASGADIVTAPVMVDDKVVYKKKLPYWLGGAFSLVSSHSVGCLFKMSVHDIYGYYSRHYPIAADKLLINQIYNNAGIIKEAGFIAGRYGTLGTSSADVLGNLTESYRVQLKTTRNKMLQTILFVFRLIKNIKRF